MIVPEAGVVDQNDAPKLIGNIDLHSAERHARYLKIGIATTGTVVILVLVCVLYFHNKWERDNRAQLLALKAQADALIQAKKYERANLKYHELFGLLGDRDVTDDHLKSEIESARLAVIENNKKVEAILAARAAAEQEELRRVAQADALVASQLPSERYYRDSHGAIVSGTETEASLARIRSKIRSMPDNAERAYMEGVLSALEDEWARMKQQGPINR